MNIALIGASGFVGTALLRELLDRGHQVTAIARNVENINVTDPLLKPVTADVLATGSLTDIVKGHDAVISAYNPGWTNPNIYTEFLQGAKNIAAAVKEAGVKRFVIIGGAGSLFVAPGVQLIDTPEFPAEIKPGAMAAKDYLHIIKEEKDLDWTFFSPAIEMHRGTSGIRKGSYRTGLESPVFNEEGRSILSVEDLAVVIVDELEHPKHSRQRFTAAY